MPPQFVEPQRFGFPDFDLKMARRLLPMAAGWWVYGVSGVIALQYLNVPMFSSFRRFTTLIVMFGEYKIRGRLPPRNQQAAVLVRLTLQTRPPPLPRTNRTSLVPPLVLSGHAASLTPY